MKSKVSLEEKLQKENPEFVAEVQGLDVATLNGRLSELAKGAEDVEDAKDADEELEQARAQATELAAPYRDAKKAIRMKMRFIIALIKEKGGV